MEEHLKEDIACVVSQIIIIQLFTMHKYFLAYQELHHQSKERQMLTGDNQAYSFNGRVDPSS